MRKSHRIVLLAALAVMLPALSACSGFDPDDMDIFHLNDKKKLPGERRELFPTGVPGVSKGIPPEYMIGHQRPQDAAIAMPVDNKPPEPQADAKQQIAEPAAKRSKTAAIGPQSIVPEEEAASTEKPKPKPKAKAKAKPKHKPTLVTVQPARQAPQQAQQQQPQQQTAPWPNQPPPQQQQQQAPWPNNTPSQ